MALEFRVLGPFEVVAPDGRKIDLGGPKQRAVLALLTLHANRVVSLDRLVEDLWRGTPPARAAATLQAYVSNLRRLLEPDRPARAQPTVLVSRSPGYQLTVAPGHMDAAEFERLVGSARSATGTDPVVARDVLGEALDLWRGPALADMAYEPFAAAEIARLEELRVNAIEERIDADLALGRHDALVAEVEHLLAEHPLRERLWGQLMVALYRSGRQAEALRAYRRCQARLAEELGIDPGPELQRLEAAVLRQDGSLDATARAPDATKAPSSTMPIDRAAADRDDRMLLAREVEVAAFRAAVDDAGRGRGAVLLVEGEPGIGKTRLLEALDREARARGVPSSLARCVEVGGTPPFWPWTQIIRGLTASVGVEALVRAAGPHARHLASILPELNPSPDIPGRLAATDLTPHRVAEAIVAATRTLTDDRPLVMLIDDLYSADPDSVSLLVLLAAEVATLGLVVVGSYRTTEVADDHPLAHALAQFTRIEGVSRFPLNRFAVDEVGRLVRQVSGVEVADDTVEAIHARTGGNAFFTVELTRLLAAESGLTPTQVDQTIPNTVRDVLRRRLARLDADTIRLLRAAAVCGRRWHVDVAAEVAGLPGATALDAVDLAVGAGLVEEDGEPGRYRFAHVLVGDAVAHSLSALRRAQLHRLTAEVMGRRAENDPTEWVEIAHHAVEAVPVAGAGPAVGPLAEAGRHALRSNAYELAEQLFERRLRVTLSLPPSVDRNELEVAALVDLAVVWTWREGYHSDRLNQAGARLMELASALTEMTQAAIEPARLHRVVLPAFQARLSQEIVSGRVDDTERTVAMLDELTADDSNHDPLLEFTAAANGLVVAVHSGRVGEALDRSARCAALVPILDPGETGTVMLPLGQQVLAVTFHAFNAWGQWLAGDTAAARHELVMTRMVTERSGHGFTRVFAGVVEGLVAGMEGAPDWAADAMAWTNAGRDIDEYGLGTVWIQAISAWADGMANDPAAAAERLRAAIERLDEMGARVTMTEYLGLLADLELAADRPAAALAAASAGIERSAVHGERYWYPELERLQAIALARLDRVDEAEAAVRRGTDAARELGIVPIRRRLDDQRGRGLADLS